MFKNIDEKEFIDISKNIRLSNINIAKIISKKLNVSQYLVQYVIEFYTMKFISFVKRFEINGISDLNKLDITLDEITSKPSNSCDLDFFFNTIIQNPDYLKNNKIFTRNKKLHPINNLIRYYKFILFFKFGVYKNKNIFSFTDIDNYFKKFLKIDKNITEFRCFEWIPFQFKFIEKLNFSNLSNIKFCNDNIINTFINKYYFKFLPNTVIQSLKFSKKFKKLQFKSINTCSQLYNDFFNVVLFSQVSKKLECRVGQHGIDYGLKKNLKHYYKTKEEKNNSIKFYSWWKKKPNDGEYINGRYFGRLFSTEVKQSNKILFVMPLPPFDSLLDNPENYKKFKKNLINISMTKSKFRMYLKLHNNYFDLDGDKNFIEVLRQNEVTIVEDLKINDEFIAKFNTVVYGYLSTGFFESLLSGIKTKCIDIYEESNDWRSNKLIDQLKKKNLITNNLPNNLDSFDEIYNSRDINNILSEYISINN